MNSPTTYLADNVLPRDMPMGELAATLDVPVQELMDTLAGKTPITPRVACQIEKVYGMNAMSLLIMQATYALWAYRRRPNAS